MNDVSVKILINPILFDEDGSTNEWRGQLLADNSTEFNLPVVSEKYFMNLSDTFHFRDSVTKFGQLTIWMNFEFMF